jgi:hypothetical protein
MAKREKKPPVAIGFRVKTARATAVFLAAPIGAPQILGRRPVELWDPDVPETRQPYHAALELPANEGAKSVQRATQAVQAVAIRAVRALVTELRGQGHDVQGVGLVVGSDTDPDKLKNPHVRAHAAEGRLFREVLEAGADACDLPHLVLVERDAYTKASAVLRRPVDEIKQTIQALGHTIEGPWRSEEKTAALAAWLALAPRTRAR